MYRMTVLLPTRPGRARYLAEAIASVKAQTVPVRLLMACNGVDPAPYRDVADLVWWRSEFADDAGEWSGHALYEMWGGDGYACTLHDDDTMAPDRCEKMAALLDSGYDLAFSAMEMFDNDGQSVTFANDARLWDVRDFSTVVGHTVTPSAAFNARILEVEPPKGYRCGAQDSLFWMRCLAAGLKVTYTEEVLYRYRFHSGEYGNASNPDNFRRFGDDVFDAEVARIWEEGRALQS